MQGRLSDRATQASASSASSSSGGGTAEPVRRLLCTVGGIPAGIPTAATTAICTASLPPATAAAMGSTRLPAAGQVLTLRHNAQGQQFHRLSTTRMADRLAAFSNSTHLELTRAVAPHRLRSLGPRPTRRSSRGCSPASSSPSSTAAWPSAPSWASPSVHSTNKSTAPLTSRATSISSEQRGADQLDEESRGRRRWTRRRRR